MENSVRQLIKKPIDGFEISEHFNHQSLIQLYVDRGIEFSPENMQFPHPIMFSYVAKIPQEGIIGAITICFEEEDSTKFYILDEVAVLEEYERRGFGSALVRTAMNRLSKELDGEPFDVYLVAKIPIFFTKNGFETITREEAPNFSECFTCSQYHDGTCRPTVMKKRFD